VLPISTWRRSALGVGSERPLCGQGDMELSGTSQVFDAFLRITILSWPLCLVPLECPKPRVGTRGWVSAQARPKRN